MSTDDETAPRKRRILIVDDHEAIRSALTAILSEEPDLIVVSADGAEQALALMQDQPADLAIVDITLGSSNGLDLTRQLLRSHPRLRVLVLSMHDASIYGPRAVRAGAAAYIAKQEASDKLIPTLRRLLESPGSDRPGTPGDSPDRS
jgi:DNA-binding NarL/FixJ family response regulator